MRRPSSRSARRGDIPVVRWSPDGRTLLFMRDGQISLLPAGGGESRVLTRHAPGVSAVPSPSWSPDGTAVYFVASDPPTAEERERSRLRDDVFALDENFRHRQLWKIVVATGAETQLTSGDSSVMEYKLSTDGTRIAVQRAPSPLPADAHRGEVWVMDAERRERPRADEQRDRRGRPGALAGQLAGVVPRRHERTVRTVLPDGPVRRAGGGRQRARGAARLPLHDRAGDLGAGRPFDPGEREHGRPQRAVPDRGGIGPRAAADRRRAFHRRRAGPRCRAPARS